MDAQSKAMVERHDFQKQGPRYRAVRRDEAHDTIVSAGPWHNTPEAAEYDAMRVNRGLSRSAELAAERAARGGARLTHSLTHGAL